MKKHFFLILFLLIFCGCETVPTKSEPTYEEAAQSKFIQANYMATDKMLSTISEPLSKDSPIVVATLVNIDDLSESSRLGRLTSEQMGAHLAGLGYQVIELKLRGDIFVKEHKGELLLSREVKDIMLNHQAQAVVVGTYSEARDFVYINIKIVSGQNNLIIAAYDYALPKDKNVKALLPSPAR